MNRKLTEPISDTFRYLALSVLCTYFGYGFASTFIPGEITTFVTYVPLLLLGTLVLVLTKKIQIPLYFSMNFVYMFAFIDGMLSYPLVKPIVEESGTQVIIAGLLTSVAIVAIYSIIALKKIDGYYRLLDNILFILLIISAILNGLEYITKSEVIDVISNLLVLFTLFSYTLLDISRLKFFIKDDDGEESIIKERDDLASHVTNLYLNFISSFVLFKLIYVTSYKLQMREHIE